MTRHWINTTRATGYETMRSGDGSILQAGIPSRTAAMHQDLSSVQGWITRAVVIKTYYAEEDTRSGWTIGLQRSVLCDVRTYGRYSRPLSKVPVMQRTQGRYDEDVYIPRDSRQDMEGGTLATGGSKSPTRPTPAENMDGDHVLVGFLDNDPQQPIILPYVFAHPKSAYKPSALNGRVRRIRHQGTLVEWDKDGNFTIDATGVASEILGPRGAEVAAPGKGVITFKNKDTLGKQLSVVLDAGTTPTGRILLGSDPASPPTEPLVLGTLWINLMGRLLDEINRITVGTPSGTSTVPLNAVAFGTLKAEIEAQTQVSDFIFAKKTQ